MFPQRLIPALTLGAASLLGACSETSTGASPAQTARAVSAAAPPAAVGTRFDGRYVGSGTLTMSRAPECGAQTQTRSITVVNGNATYVVDQVRNIIVTGQVQPDGSVSMAGTTDSSSRVIGRIQGREFRGDFQSRTCSRSLVLRRGGTGA